MAAPVIQHFDDRDGDLDDKDEAGPSPANARSSLSEHLPWRGWARRFASTWACLSRSLQTLRWPDCCTTWAGRPEVPVLAQRVRRTRWRSAAKSGTRSDDLERGAVPQQSGYPEGCAMSC